MPNKPDKFGMKFWILAEVKSKYCLNIKPYLGKDEQRVDCVGTCIIMKLMELYFSRGYNVTTDSFSTSWDLALKLLDKHSSLVGTVRLNCKEVCRVISCQPTSQRSTSATTIHSTWRTTRLSPARTLLCC